MRDNAFKAVGIGAAVVVALIAGIVLGPKLIGQGALRVNGADQGSRIEVRGPMSPSEPYGVLSTATVCLTSGDEVTIDRVEPLDVAGGLEVTDFSVFGRTGNEGVEGFARQRLDETVDEIDHDVTVQCAEQEYSWLYIEIARPERSKAAFRGLRIHYGNESADVPFDLMVCHDACPDP